MPSLTTTYQIRAVACPIVVNVRSTISPRMSCRSSGHPRLPNHETRLPRVASRSVAKRPSLQKPIKVTPTFIPNSPPFNAEPRLSIHKSNARLALPPRAATNTTILPPTRIPAQDSVATLAPQRQHPRQWQRAPHIHERQSEQAAESFSGAVCEARDQEGASS